MRRLVLALTLALTTAIAPAAMANEPVQLLEFDDLDGWAADDHAAALSVFRNTCMDLDGSDWAALCGLADAAPDPRTFFELFFRPVLIGGENPALFTGYYEPELSGSRTRTSRYRFPVYRLPPEARGRWLSREQIEESRVLEGRGLEIAWVDDAVELFFLQIQGSGRISLAEGGFLRVGYGGRNGHEYRSVGKSLCGAESTKPIRCPPK